MNILAFLCVMIFVGSLANAIQSLFVFDIGFTATELGVLLSAIGFSFLVSDILLSYIFDNKSRRTSIFLGHILIGIFAFIMVQADSVQMLMIAGLFVGVANACFSGAMQAIYIENADGDMQKIIGKLGVYVGVAGIASLLAGSATAYTLGFKTLYTWMGWLNFLVAPFVFVFLPKNRETAGFSTEQLKSDCKAISAIYFGGNKWITVWGLVLALATTGIASYWLYYVFGENSVTDNILVVSLIALIFMVVGTITSAMIQRFSLKTVFMFAIAFIGVSVVAVLPVVGEHFTMDYNGKIQFITSVILVDMGVMLLAGLNTVYFQRLISDRLRATASSFIGSIKAILTIIFVPIMGMAVTDYGYLPFVAMYGITAMAGVLFVIAMLKKSA